MATLLCIPQFIALNFLAHTFASGHCSLRHARGKGALILPSMLPCKCSLCKWLLLFLHSANGLVASACREQLQARGSGSVGVGFFGGWPPSHPWFKFPCRWLLVTKHRSKLWKICSQVHTRFILYLIASESNHSLPYKSLVKLSFTIEP